MTGAGSSDHLSGVSASAPGRPSRLTPAPLSPLTHTRVPSLSHPRRFEGALRRPLWRQLTLCPPVCIAQCVPGCVSPRVCLGVYRPVRIARCVPGCVSPGAYGPVCAWVCRGGTVEAGDGKRGGLRPSLLRFSSGRALGHFPRCKRYRNDKDGGAGAGTLMETNGDIQPSGT